MSRMKVALAILLLACQELNDNVVRRDASPSEVYATEENIRNDSAKILTTINATLETLTEGSEHERVSDVLKNDTETKEDNNGINSANLNISLSMQHGIYLKTPMPQVQKPERAHYETGKRIGLRMARDTDDDEENDIVDDDGEGNNDEDNTAHRPADEVVKTQKVPISAKFKADAFKPVDVHIYIHVDEPRRMHVSWNKTRNTCSNTMKYITKI